MVSSLHGNGSGPRPGANLPTLSVSYPRSLLRTLTARFSVPATTRSRAITQTTPTHRMLPAAQTAASDVLGAAQHMHIPVRTWTAPTTTIPTRNAFTMAAPEPGRSLWDAPALI